MSDGALRGDVRWGAGARRPAPPEPGRSLRLALVVACGPRWGRAMDALTAVRYDRSWAHQRVVRLMAYVLASETPPGVLGKGLDDTGRALGPCGPFKLAFRDHDGPWSAAVNRGVGMALNDRAALVMVLSEECRLNAGAVEALVEYGLARPGDMLWGPSPAGMPALTGLESGAGGPEYVCSLEAVWEGLDRRCFCLRPGTWAALGAFDEGLSIPGAAVDDYLARCWLRGGRAARLGCATFDSLPPAPRGEAELAADLARLHEKWGSAPADTREQVIALYDRRGLTWA